ncbi:hypothetical protein [Alienimonas chondri]|uniref:Uncharacterized protein n=1 Tax=Alienimonas chondri TaxID=2681879 RepID=A0ABX1VHF4_9PLAN|nr:hypothetical protein [Alienimonas chondri]NNJ27273.1 hypothetical protein [Alienimonas chondri]
MSSKLLHAGTAFALLLVAAFCGYGWLASFEPTAHAWAWQIGYAVSGLTALTAAILQLKRAATTPV